MSARAADVAGERPGAHAGLVGPRQVGVVVSGLGSVGLSLLRLIDERALDLARQHGLSFVVLAVVDSSGAALHPSGLDVATVVAMKEGRAAIGDLPGSGRRGLGVAEVLVELDAHGARADVLVEAGPSDLVDGGAGLIAVLAAQSRGMGVVLANKAPLVVAWEQIAGDHAGRTAPVRFSACVGAALPTVDLARSVLASASATRVEIVLNSTCQRVLGDMGSGLEVDEAIARAQAAGLAEADPSLDVDGIDTAIKLVILCSALGFPVPLSAVSVTGIRDVTARQIEEARERGRALVLLGVAEPAAGDASHGWRLRVEPQALPIEHPLARMDRHETGMVVHTDVAGRISASGWHRDAGATGAAVLRDVIAIAKEAPRAAGRDS